MSKYYGRLSGVLLVALIACESPQELGGDKSGASVGGKSSRGGSGVGGSAVGGTAVGGSAVGGSAVGGSAVGGSAVGGSAVGGSAVGGSAVGGSAVGGSAVGGSAVGPQPAAQGGSSAGNGGMTGGSASQLGGATNTAGGSSANAGAAGSAGSASRDQTCKWAKIDFTFTVEDKDAFCAGGGDFHEVEILTSAGHHVTHLDWFNSVAHIERCPNCGLVSEYARAAVQGPIINPVFRNTWRGDWEEFRQCNVQEPSHRCGIRHCVAAGTYVARFCLAPKGSATTCERTMPNLLPRTACVDVAFDLATTTAVSGTLTKAMIPGTAGAGGAAGAAGAAGTGGTAGGAE